jgi:hypothetical protein
MARWHPAYARWPLRLLEVRGRHHRSYHVRNSEPPSARHAVGPLIVEAPAGEPTGWRLRSSATGTRQLERREFSLIRCVRRGVSKQRANTRPRREGNDDRHHRRRSAASGYDAGHAPQRSALFGQRLPRIRGGRDGRGMSSKGATRPPSQEARKRLILSSAQVAEAHGSRTHPRTGSCPSNRFEDGEAHRDPSTPRGGRSIAVWYNLACPGLALGWLWGSGSSGWRR